MFPLLVVMVVLLRVAGMAQYSMIPANARRKKQRKGGVGLLFRWLIHNVILFSRCRCCFDHSQESCFKSPLLLAAVVRVNVDKVSACSFTLL
jgi:hypothetical protein